METRLDASGFKIGIVVGRFNEMVTRQLHRGAISTLRQLGAEEDQIQTVWVPGSFEIPLAAQKLAGTGVDGVICLGTLIRGETDHYDVLAASVTNELMRLSTTLGLPLAFGILTCETVEQALNRAGLKYGNKGSEAATALVEMIQLSQGFAQSSSRD